MSMRLMAQAMSIKVGNPLRKLVLIKLADNANDGGVCFPSYQYIADVCEISKASARNHIDALVEIGLVSKKARRNKDGSSSNLYTLHLDKGMLTDSTGMLTDSTGGMLGDSTITYHSINLSNNHNNPLPLNGESADAEHLDVGGADKPHTGKKQNPIKVNYSEVAETYNRLVKELNSNLPLIANPSQLSDKRKKAIKKLAQVFIKRFEIDNDVESALGEYFKDFLTSATNFYFGENNRGWKADFEYILRETTLDKVLEGNW
nr:helix-turn-helix domain-containing protein [uncultured Haemophilus sp.]